jgi:hypothetical protein
MCKLCTRTAGELFRLNIYRMRVALSLRGTGFLKVKIVRTLRTGHDEYVSRVEYFVPQKIYI